jgi:hypothetical protein
MNITSAQYQNNPVFGEAEHNIVVIIDGETLIVPLDPANRHYAAILEWVADGNTIQDAE